MPRVSIPFISREEIAVHLSAPSDGLRGHSCFIAVYWIYRNNKPKRKGRWPFWRAGNASNRSLGWRKEGRKGGRAGWREGEEGWMDALKQGGEALKWDIVDLNKDPAFICAFTCFYLLYHMFSLLPYRQWLIISFHVIVKWQKSKSLTVSFCTEGFFNEAPFSRFYLMRVFRSLIHYKAWHLLEIVSGWAKLTISFRNEQQQLEY